MQEHKSADGGGFAAGHQQTSTAFHCCASCQYIIYEEDIFAVECIKTVMFQQKGAGYVLKPLFACKAAHRAGVGMTQQNIWREYGHYAGC